MSSNSFKVSVYSVLKIVMLVAFDSLTAHNIRLLSFVQTVTDSLRKFKENLSMLFSSFRGLAPYNLMHARH